MRVYKDGQRVNGMSILSEDLEKQAQLVWNELALFAKPDLEN
jgi:hypothetical protein